MPPHVGALISVSDEERAPQAGEDRGTGVSPRQGRTVARTPFRRDSCHSLTPAFGQGRRSSSLQRPGPRSGAESKLIRPTASRGLSTHQERARVANS